MMLAVLFAFCGVRAESGVLCVLKQKSVDESSGIAVSHRRSGVYWTHNDSGDGPNLYAFDEKGNDLGVFALEGAVAVDWEDMASVRIRGSAYLYAGDIGDNGSRRETIRVYRLLEPLARPGKHVVKSYETYTLRYPDGPHDCETLLAAPNGDLQVVTKSFDGLCKVYGLTAPKGSGSYSLSRLGELQLNDNFVMGRLATGGAINETGTRVLIRTYSAAWLFETANLKEWFRSKPVMVDLPKEPQGEAICFDDAKHRFLTSSEGVPCTVHYVMDPKTR